MYGRTSWQETADRFGYFIGEVIEFVAYGFVRIVAAVWWRLWALFGALDWIAKGFAVAIAIYAFGYVAGRLGADGLAHDAGQTALTLGAYVATAAIIRHIWRNAPSRRRQPF